MGPRRVSFVLALLALGLLVASAGVAAASSGPDPHGIANGQAADHEHGNDVEHGHEGQGTPGGPGDPGTPAAQGHDAQDEHGQDQGEHGSGDHGSGDHAHGPGTDDDVTAGTGAPGADGGGGVEATSVGT